MRLSRAWAGCLVIVMAGLAATCGGDRGPAGWEISTETLPSGAVRVVNTPPADGIEPTWVVEEELRIGVLDGDGPDAFGQIKGLLVVEDGQVVVLDADAQELRIFGPDGEYLRTMGRRGEGPGEFSSANGIMRAPDGRIWVVDPGLARMSVFHLEHGFETSHRWDRRSFGFIWNGVMDDEGRILEPTVIPVDGDMWQIIRVYDPRMTLLDSIPVRSTGPPGQTDSPGSFHFEAATQGGSVRGLMGVPFYARAQSWLDPALAYWSTGDGDPSYRLTRWVPGGDTTLVVESRRPPVPVTPAQRDSAIASVRDFFTQRGADPRLDWSKIPDTRPAITGIFISGEGDIWARVTTPDPTARTWDVFGPDGRYQGTAITNLRVSSTIPPVIRGDRFWAVVTDELQVQYVVAGRLRRAAAVADG
jgi:hypothetical protein